MNLLTGPYAYFLATRIRQRQITKNLGLRKEDLLLDAGCGLGYFVLRFRGVPAKTCGIDIDQDALNTVKIGNGGFFACADIAALPFKDSVFTKLILSEVLEHLPEEKSALNEIRRVCANFAKILITVPCSEGNLRLTKMRRLGHDQPGTEFHFRDGYTKKGLEDLLLSSGFKIEKIYYCGGLFSELIIQLSKFIFLRKKKSFTSQKDIVVKGGLKTLFNIYRYLFFPLFNLISFLEDELTCRLFGGYTLVARVENEK